MVQDLLELKSKLDTVIYEAFQGNDRLHDVVRESFESVVNRRQNKPAELIGTVTLSVSEGGDDVCLLCSQVRGHTASGGEQGMVRRRPREAAR